MAFSSQNLLSETLGFAALWAASRWNKLPQFHVDDGPVQDRMVLGRISRSTVFRIAASVSLVGFQWLLTAADEGTRWVIPLITIGVFAIVRLSHRFDPTSTQSYALLSPARWTAPKLDVKEPSTLPFISVAAASLLLWTDIQSQHSFGLPFFLLVSGVSFFACLSQVSGSSEDGSEKIGANPENSRRLIKSISFFAGTVSLVPLIFVVTGLTQSFDFLVVLQALVKAVQAFGLICFASENALAASSTVSLAAITVIVLEEPSMFPGVRPLLAFCGSAVQLALSAPKSNDKRLALFGFLFLPGLILPLSGNFHLAASIFRSATGTAAPLITDDTFERTHPVEKLHLKWLRDFEQKKERQSKTMDDAVAQYRLRYQMEPPPGFDVWFEFAKERKYIMVDEFDTLMTSMKPFWDVRPKDLRSRIRSTADKGEQFAELEVIDCNVTRMSWDHWYTGPVKKWFDIFRPLGILPDFNFTMNAYDEPRTIFYPSLMGGASVQHLNGKTLISSVEKNNVTWTNIQKIPVYPEIAPACPKGGFPEADDESGWTLSSNGIKFMDAHSSHQDICLSRSLRTEHGFFRAPDSARVTHHVVPVFSQAAPQRYTDILYPTPFYYNAVEGDREEIETDMSWDAKKDQIYWAGSSTGGYHTMENWKHIHRARVSMMTSPNSIEDVTLLERNKLGKWQSIRSWWGSISKYFNVHVTRLVQCEEHACKEMEKVFNLVQQPSNTYLQYKYVLDLDGNSYTGRYYRLLRSSSCVVKSTVFREWHDDILTPWVHYIPLSNSAQELGEMMRFLVSDPRGSPVGQAIGKTGHDWAEVALRKADMEVYALRVFMEYARLFDEERDTHVFQPRL